MTGPVGTSGRFVKPYASAGIAREAMRRSAMARAAGVPTPEAQAGPTPESLAFDRIDGESGVGLLRDGDLKALLAPLRALQAAPPVGLSRFDPFLRIRPRLATGAFPGVTPDLIAALSRDLPACGGTVHGDFHFGQLIRDRNGKVWVLDLDDMAIGPAEADLGNLAAHLATTSATAEGPLETALAQWRGRIIAAWGQPCDMATLDRFKRIAALRRALKLKEQGRADLLPELLPLLSRA